MMPTFSYYKNHLLLFANKGNLSVLKNLGIDEAEEIVEVEDEPGGVTHVVLSAFGWNGATLDRMEFCEETHCDVRDTDEPVS